MQTKLVLPCPVLVAACDDLMLGQVMLREKQRLWGSELMSDNLMTTADYESVMRDDIALQVCCWLVKNGPVRDLNISKNQLSKLFSTKIVIKLNVISHISKYQLSKLFSTKIVITLLMSSCQSVKEKFNIISCKIQKEVYILNVVIYVFS